MKILIQSISALVLTTAICTADEKPPGTPRGPGGGDGPRERPNPEQLFKRLDSNNDGQLSLDEFRAGGPGRPGERRAEGEGQRPQRDGERGPNAGERRGPRDGDREAHGDKGPRPPRDGDRGPEAGERRGPRPDRDGDRPEGGDRRGPGDGDRRPEGGDRRPDGGGDRQPPSREDAFKRLDKNGDGNINLDEFRAQRPPQGHGRPDGDSRGPGRRGPGGGRPPGDRN